MTAPLAPRTLTTGDLRLRPVTEADEAAVADAMTDPGILRWAAGIAVNRAAVPDRARTYLLPRLTAWSNGTAAFAVTGAGDDTMLGYVALRDINRVPDQGLAAYWVTPAARGRALAARALCAVADWAFRPVGSGGLGLHRVSLDHALENVGSCRVAERAGFCSEGTMRGSFLAPDGQRHDSHLHARLATDAAPAAF